MDLSFDFAGLGHRFASLGGVGFRVAEASCTSVQEENTPGSDHRQSLPFFLDLGHGKVLFHAGFEYLSGRGRPAAWSLSRGDFCAGRTSHEYARRLGRFFWSNVYAIG